MLSPELLQDVNHEQFKDLLKELEQRKLVQLANEQNSGLRLHARAAGWLGTQLVKAGSKLQSYDAPAPSKRIATKI